ncbi:MAG: hypothetical protein IKF51_06635 [Solobacterium sp.]|nr:hypothetical protein [Solobacterium sp.]
MKKFENKLMGIVFLILIFLLSVGTMVRVFHYRTSDEAINEQLPEDATTEQEMNAVFYEKEEFIRLNGFMRRMLGQRMLNGVVRLNNGQLTYLHEAIEEEVLRQNADNITAFYRYVSGRGIPVFFAITPDKVSMYDDELPAGYTDYSNANIEIFLQRLQENGTPYIDLREELHKVDPDLYRFFYLTDHHWTTEGGFYAFCALADAMRSAGIPIAEEITDVNNYTQEVHPDCQFGSWGQRVGRGFADEEDFALWIPTYETHIMRRFDELRGTFSEVLYDRTVFDTNTDGLVYDGVLLNTTRFVNEGNSNGLRVLMIGDSMARTVNPYFVQAFREFYWGDAYHSEEITEAKINEINPDVIVLMISPWNNLGSEASFSYPFGDAQ